MKKRLLTMLLSACMAATLLAGCGSSDGNGVTEAENDDTEASADVESDTESDDAEETADDELVEIVWQIPLEDEIPVGFQDVEDAFNAMVEKDLGVHVTFEPSKYLDCPKNALLMISADEQLDIMNSAVSSVGGLVEAEAIIPLDDLLAEHGQAILEDLDPSQLGRAQYQGQQYGFTRAYPDWGSGGIAIRKDLVEKYNIEYDYSKTYTLEEIGDIFGIMKEGEGENFYPLIAWNHPTAVTLNSNCLAVDRMGGGEEYGAGVLMLNRSFEDPTVVNFFETEEFEEICYILYDWMQAGYFQPDAATTTMLPAALVAEPNYGALPFACCFVDENNSALNDLSDYDWIQFRLVDNYIAGGGSIVAQWHITSSCENPDKAMQVLNYIYENPEAATLLQYGLEGESWKVVEETEEGMQIELLGTPAELPYYEPHALYGDSTEIPSVAPLAIGATGAQAEIVADIPDSRRSLAVGFVFDSTPVQAELTAVSTVIATYTPTLTTGSANPDEILPEFRAALKDAGIDIVIAESQRQLDEWMAK